jgi:hypothetical protein
MTGSHTIHLLIPAKLSDGRLPYNSTWGSSSGNRGPCDACEEILTEGEIVTSAVFLSGDRPLIQLHVGCFRVWESEHRASQERFPAKKQPVEIICPVCTKAIESKAPKYLAPFRAVPHGLLRDDAGVHESASRHRVSGLAADHTIPSAT